jgi:hypothetical protein
MDLALLFDFLNNGINRRTSLLYVIESFSMNRSETDAVHILHRFIKDLSRVTKNCGTIADKQEVNGGCDNNKQTRLGWVS